MVFLEDKATGRMHDLLKNGYAFKIFQSVRMIAFCFISNRTWRRVKRWRFSSQEDLFM